MFHDFYFNIAVVTPKPFLFTDPIDVNNNLTKDSDAPIELDLADVKSGMWVKVTYEEEWFLGKVVEKFDTRCSVRCLEKPFGVREPQNMEPEKHTVVYDKVYDTEGIVPKQVYIKRTWKWTY